MARKRPVQQIKNIILDRSPVSIVVLMIMSLAVFQILTIIFTKLFDFPMVKVGIGFLLFVVAAAIILPYIMIIGDVRFDSSLVWMIIIVLILDVVFLVYIAPKMLPQVFSALEVVWP